MSAKVRKTPISQRHYQAQSPTTRAAHDSLHQPNQTPSRRYIIYPDTTSKISPHKTPFALSDSPPKKLQRLTRSLTTTRTLLRHRPEQKHYECSVFRLPFFQNHNLLLPQPPRPLPTMSAFCYIPRGKKKRTEKPLLMPSTSQPTKTSRPRRMLHLLMPLVFTPKKINRKSNLDRCRVDFHA